MIYCDDCGEEFIEKYKYCPKCGAKLSEYTEVNEVELKEVKRTTLDLDENIEGALSYLLLFVSGIILYFIEEESYFVKFHAFQSSVIFIILFLLGVIFSFIPYLGVVISIIAGLITFIVWIVGMFEAYRGRAYKFPIVGDIAENHLRKKSRSHL